MDEKLTPRLRVVERRAIVLNPDAGPDDTPIEVTEFLSPEFAHALIDPQTQKEVDHDTQILTENLFVNPTERYRKPSIELTIIDKDRETLTPYETINDRATLIPGLLGLDDIDAAGNTHDNKRNLVRLYCGVMLAHDIVRARYLKEEFFRKCIHKMFPLPKPQSYDTHSILTFEDPHVQRRHGEIILARFAGGAALHMLFSDSERQDMLDVLNNKYLADIDEMLSISRTTSDLLFLPNQQLPEDLYPATAKGFANPFEPQVIQTTLLGRIARG